MRIGQVARHSPLPTPQMRTLLSSLQEATCDPSPLNATPLTSPVWPCRHNNIPRPRTTSPQTQTLLLLLCGAWVVPTSIAYPAIKLCSSYLWDDVCACACAHAACVYMHVWNNRRRGCPVTLLSPSSSQNTAPSDQSTTSQRRTHTLLRVLAVLVYSCKKSACTVFLLHRQTDDASCATFRARHEDCLLWGSVASRIP